MRVMASQAEIPPWNTRETPEIFEDPRKHFLYLCEVQPRQHYVTRKWTLGCGRWCVVSTRRTKSTPTNPWLAVCPHPDCGKKARMDLRTRERFPTRQDALREAARRNGLQEEE